MFLESFFIFIFCDLKHFVVLKKQSRYCKNCHFIPHLQDVSVLTKCCKKYAFLMTFHSFGRFEGLARAYTETYLNFSDERVPNSNMSGRLQ